jgi:hypothetical protein
VKVGNYVLENSPYPYLLFLHHGLLTCDRRTSFGGESCLQCRAIRGNWKEICERYISASPRGRQGGGTVYVGPRTYTSGPIELKDNEYLDRW